MNRRPSDLGLIAAVPTAPLVVAIGMLVPTGAAPPADLLTSLGFLPLLYLFALWSVILLGLPMYLLGRRLRLVRWWSAAIAGALAGAMADILIRDLRLPASDELLRFAVIGAAAGFSFWGTLHVTDRRWGRPG